MKCQHCGHLETSVLETRSMTGGTVLRRRRKCGRCLEVSETFEVQGPVYGLISDRVPGKARELKADQERRAAQERAHINAECAARIHAYLALSKRELTFLSKVDAVSRALLRGDKIEFICKDHQVSTATVERIRKHCAIPPRHKSRAGA